MSNQMTLPGLFNAISSPESAFGAMPCAGPGGPTTGQCGPEAAPASLSARRAKEKGLLTSGTYGPRGSISSISAALSKFLANRLRQKTDSLGSTLYKLTWKERITPAGRSIPALRASVRRTSGKDFIGWPTPCQQDGPHGGPNQGTDRLPGAAALTGWTTPSATDGERSGTMTENMTGSSLTQLASLSGWPTPRSAEAGPDFAIENRPNSGGKSLQTTAQLSGWATPTTMDYKVNLAGWRSPNTVDAKLGSQKSAERI